MAELPCPSCGSALTFLDQYQRYYCHRCLQYAPEGYGDYGAQTCPTCGGILSYVRQYGRMYCYHCNAYPPEPAAAKPEVVAPTRTPVELAPPTFAPEATAQPAAIAPSTVPRETALVATAAPPPSPEPEAKPAETATEAIKPEAPSPPPAAAPETAATLPQAAPVEQEPPKPSMEMRLLAKQKPAAVRVKLFALKKPELVDLSRVYDLDPSGTKEDLQQRLLSHLHDLEMEGEPVAEEEPPAATVPASEIQEPSEATAQEPAAADVSPEAPTPAQVATEETTPEPAKQVQPAPAIVVPSAAPAEAPRSAPKVEHPCPTCGKELTFISQYNRYYCYACQRYAPVASRSKNACPTCGATMRWIDQHRRWWCDDCRRYAPADLPAPGASVTTAPAAAAAATPAARAVETHRHGSPASGAGLVGLGIALYIVYAFFGFLGAMLGFVTPAGVTQEMLDLLQFFAFVFVALGAIVGLYGLRDRE